MKRRAKHLRRCTLSDGVECGGPPVLPIVQPARSWPMPGCVLPVVPDAARIERLRALCSSVEEDPISEVTSRFSPAVSGSACSAIFPCFHALRVDLVSFLGEKEERFQLFPFFSILRPSCDASRSVDSASLCILWPFSAQMRGCALRT